MWKPISTVSGGTVLARQLSVSFAEHSSLAELAVPGLVAGSWVPDDRPFRAELSSRFLPNSTLVRVRLSAIVQRWNMGNTSRHTHLGFVIDGAIDVTTSNETSSHKAGNAYVFPRRSWGTITVREGVDLVHIAFSTSRLRELGIDLNPDRRWVRLDDSSLIPELRAVALAALEAQGANAHADRITDQVISELVSGLLLHSALPAAQGTLDTLRARALEMVERIHTDPDVHARDIADALNVSLRQLQRAFAAGAMNVAGELRDRRAETAIRLLSAPGTRDRRVEEIARLAGFPSAYALRSELTRRNAGTPSSIRQLGETSGQVGNLRG